MGRVVLGMLGLGTVGQGVIQLLSQQKHLVLKKIAVKDKSKVRAIKPGCPIVDDVNEILDDPEIEVLIEVMGGEHPTLEYLQRAIAQHKHIVTANKEVLAKHGPALFEQAKQKGVAIFFEASVAGGIPLISTIQKGLEANEISSVCGILNGTTNFIFSLLEDPSCSFAAALKQAQELGFAEADPTNDIEGYDVAYKLCILSALAYGRFVDPSSVYREGISSITPDDLVFAKEFGYKIKLIGTAANTDQGLSVRVHPTFVPLTHPLSSVSGSNNGIVVKGNAVGEVIMVGPGAGQLPTASAVVGDAINLASALQLPDFSHYFQTAISSKWEKSADIGNLVCPFYIHLIANDATGVIGQIGTLFGAHNISIQTLIQRGVQSDKATIIILTHAVNNGDMQKALAVLRKQEFLYKLVNAIRIYRD